MRPLAPRIAALAVAVATLLAASAADAQVYKCVDETGKTTYADAPCARGSKPLAIPDDSRSLPAGSSVCAQLADELARLAKNEAGRASPSKRRVSLHKQYEARCVGISRVPPAKR